MTRIRHMLDVSVQGFPYIVYKKAHIGRSQFLAVSQAVSFGRIGISHDPELLDHYSAGAVYLPAQHVRLPGSLSRYTGQPAITRA